ncbi:MAG: deoxyribose-phosphate aldolase [Deltaproteobacteria bacterium]|nr:MAG: deoxyribose-phosphate aldolase [Deltaproteobacteria bacterium]
MMNSPAKYIDHTLLKADATEADIAQLCEEAVEYGFASVCIAPCHVAQASRLLYGSEVAVCTVIGFPLGSQTTEIKVFETRQAVELGADEIDMVIRIGVARAADFASVLEDIQRVVAAADTAVVKVIIECCLFDEDVKRRLVDVVAVSGADYVKTSTGFAARGATLEDVRLLSKTATARIKVKAAGGIGDWPTCQAMLAAGANRIGTSSGVAIMQQWLESAGLSCR